MNKIPKNDLSQIMNYARSKIIHLYEPSSVFGEPKDLRSSLQIDHKGVYLGVVDSSNNEIIREGFMEPCKKNVLDSIDHVISILFPQLKTKGYTSAYFKTSILHICIIFDVIYMPNPMSWDENEDGLYMQWGQKYKGMYLPYQIKRLNTHKIGVLDRLCGWECRLVSNIWRSPEALLYSLKNSSISG